MTPRFAKWQPRRPSTLEEFAAIRGVGAGKLARYGEQFVAALADSGA